MQSALSISRGWIVFIAVGTMLCAAIGLAVASQVPATYAGRSLVLATPPATEAGVSLSDLELTQALMPTLAELATTAPLLERVIDASGADTDAATLARLVSVRVPANTTLLEITVLDQDPVQAAELANGIASELLNYPANAGGEAARWGASLAIVDPAVPPTTREGPGLLTSGALGAAIGLIILVSLVILVENVSQDRRDLKRPEPA